MNKINSEVYADISVIVGMMPDKLKKRISKEFINFIEENKDDTYVSNINPRVPLKKQSVRKETKEVMAIIYREYLCSAIKREELLDEDEEALKNEEQSKLGFDPRNIFKTSNDAFELGDEINALAVTEEKTGYIARIINKIKQLFKK